MGSTQFSPEEIRAAVEEAEARGTCVMAHTYTSRAARRAIQCGVRSIGHGHLVDTVAVDALVERGAFLVPTRWPPTS